MHAEIGLRNPYEIAPPPSRPDRLLGRLTVLGVAAATSLGIAGTAYADDADQGDTNPRDTYSGTVDGLGPPPPPTFEEEDGPEVECSYTDGGGGPYCHRVGDPIPAGPSGFGHVYHVDTVDTVEEERIVEQPCNEEDAATAARFNPGGTCTEFASYVWIPGRGAVQ